MPRVAAMMVLCSAAPFLIVVDAAEGTRPYRKSTLVVGASLVPACTASVTVDGWVTSGSLERLAQVSCPNTVPYRIKVSGDPGGTPIGASAAAPGTQYLVSVEF